MSTGLMEVLGSTGHLEFAWDKHDLESVRAIGDRFAELKKKGFIAFKMNEDGSKGEQVDAFDPEAGRYLLSPPLRGG